MSTADISTQATSVFIQGRTKQEAAFNNWLAIARKWPTEILEQINPKLDTITFSACVPEYYVDNPDETRLNQQVAKVNNFIKKVNALAENYNKTQAEKAGVVITEEHDYERVLKKARDAFVEKRSRAEQNFKSIQAVLQRWPEDMRAKINQRLLTETFEQIIPEWYELKPNKETANKQYEEYKQMIEECNVIVDEITVRTQELLNKYKEQL